METTGIFFRKIDLIFCFTSFMVNVVSKNIQMEKNTITYKSIGDWHEWRLFSLKIFWWTQNCHWLHYRNSRHNHDLWQKVPSKEQYSFCNLQPKYLYYFSKRIHENPIHELRLECQCLVCLGLWILWILWRQFYCIAWKRKKIII